MPSHRTHSLVRHAALIILFTLLIVPLLAASSPTALGAEDHMASAPLHFTILHTNDEHSALIPHSPAIDHDPDNPQDPTVGGFARLATLIEEIRAQKAQENEPVLLFSAGDFLGGTAFSWLAPAGYEAELALMQAMGYDAAVIGNHEFDYGPDVLADYLLSAGYPDAHQDTVILSSNARPPEGHPLAEKDLWRDTAIFELDNGITLGVFGLIGKDAQSVTADTGEIVFLEAHQTAGEMLALLRGEGAEIIVALTHSGLDEDVALAREVDGIDIIVGGHCHTELYEPVMEGDTIIVQAGSLGGYLGRLELAYGREAPQRLRVRNTETGHPFLAPIDGRIAPHPHISLLVDEYTAALNKLVLQMTAGGFEDILGIVAGSSFPLPNHPPLQESPAGNFITDGMRLITQQVTGKRVDIALQANGNIRGSIIPGSMPHSADSISLYDIATAIGMGYGRDGYAGYPIVSVYLTGEEVSRMLEVAVLLSELFGDRYFLQFSGLRYDYNPNNAVLFTIPFVNQPLPTSRAVTRAELYVGEGYQAQDDNGRHVPLQRGEERLYHLVTDSYILAYLPMVGDMIPHLNIVPKNADGVAVPLDQLDQLIVHRSDGRELKVWHTVVEYAAIQPKGEDGYPHIPEYYADTANRINQVWSFPLIAVVYLVLLLIAMIITIAIVLFARRRRQRRTAFQTHHSGE